MTAARKVIISLILLNLCLISFTNASSPSINLYWGVDGPVHSVAVQITVTEEYDNTYYCMVGFHSGYSGIQLNKTFWLFPSYRTMIFSLWNDNGNNGKYVGNDGHVYTTSFGGEGTGLSMRSDTNSQPSFANWERNKKYIFMLRAYATNGGTNIDLYFNKPEMGTNFQYFGTYFETNSHPGKISNAYSFIEDFAGNNGRRSANYKAFIKREIGGAWEGVTSVTANSQAGPHNIRVAQDDEGQTISVTSGGGNDSQQGSVYLNYNPGRIPQALLNYPY